MKAPSSDAATADDEGGADKDDGLFTLDYEDFFSVLMYYGHMSKAEIMSSSRLFLYGIYKHYGKRACENLGVSPDKDDEEKDDGPIKASDYPAEFKRLTPRERKEAASEFKDTADFMRQFNGFAPGIDGSISVDKH